MVQTMPESQSHRTAKRSALVFAINYEPEISGNAPYTTGLARHLANEGWAVEVVSGYPHYPHWRKQSAARLVRDEGVVVYRRRHYVPRKPTALRRGLFEASWLASSLPAALRASKVDVVIGVVPSLGGAVLARIASWRRQVPYVLWIQDVMGQAAVQSGTKGGARVARAVRAAERWASKDASRIMIVAESFRPYFERAGVEPGRIVRVRNWGLLPPAQADRVTTLRSMGIDPNTLVAVHSGNMGAKQDLDVILDAATNEPDITFILQGSGNMRLHLEQRVRDENIGNIRFLDQLPPQDLSNLLAAADVLLIAQRPSVDDMSLPSKLATYAASASPIVAIVAPQSETAAEVRALGGRVVPQPANASEIVNAIRHEAGRSARRSDGPTLNAETCIRDIAACVASAIAPNTQKAIT